MDFPTWLRVRMAEKNIDNKGLGIALGVSHVAVGRWTRGDNRPKYEHVLRLADHFRAPHAEVLTLAGYRLTNPGIEAIQNPRTADHSDPEFGQVLTLFTQLGPDDRARILAIMRTFIMEKRPVPARTLASGRT